MSDLVGNPEDLFSHNEAYLFVAKLRLHALANLKRSFPNFLCIQQWVQHRQVFVVNVFVFLKLFALLLVYMT